MRTKTLLVAASLLAAGALSSMAQSNVYSLNIVGYANVTIGGGNGFYANPFNAIDPVSSLVNNSATNVLGLAPLDDNGANPNNKMNNFFLLKWNGGGFDQWYYANYFTVGNYGPGYSGWANDANGTTALAAPDLVPGLGFIINNNGPVYTNVFVGNVTPSPGTTNIHFIHGGNDLISSTLSVGGNQTGLTSPLPSPLAALDDNGANPNNYFNNFFILKWNGGGFDQSYYANYFTPGNYGPGYAGWANNANGDVAVPAPSIPIGSSFYINNNGPTGNWIQYYTNAP